MGVHAAAVDADVDQQRLDGVDRSWRAAARRGIDENREIGLVHQRI